MSVQTVNVTVTNTANDIHYNPTDAWTTSNAPAGQATFFWGDGAQGLETGYITYSFFQPATGFEYWGYQRSDGGLFSICFDCPAAYSETGDPIDFFNASTNGNQPPSLLYSNYELSYGIHTITISNLPDARATYKGFSSTTGGGYGQLNLDHFVLISPDTQPPTPSASLSGTSSATSSGSPSTVPSGSSSTVPSGTPSTVSPKTPSIVASESPSTVPITTTSSTTSAAGTSSSPFLPSVPTVAAGESSESSSIVGAIAGGVAGGVVGLALIALFLWFFLLRNRPPRGTIQDMNDEDVSVSSEPKDASALAAVPLIFYTPMPHVGYTDQASANEESRSAAFNISQPLNGSSKQNGDDRPLTAAAGRAASSTPKSARIVLAPPVTRATVLPSSTSVYRTISQSSGLANGSATLLPHKDRDAGFLQGDGQGMTLPPDYDTITAHR